MIIVLLRILNSAKLMLQFEDLGASIFDPLNLLLKDKKEPLCEISNCHAQILTTPLHEVAIAVALIAFSLTRTLIHKGRRIYCLYNNLPVCCHFESRHNLLFSHINKLTARNVN